MLKSVFNQLSITRNELVDLIEILSKEDLLYSTQMSWSLSEILEHLYLVEQKITKGIVFYSSQPEAEPTSEKPIHYIVDRSKKIQAPKNVHPTGVEISKEQHLLRLEASRKSLLETVSSIDEPILKERSFPHPFLGPLSLFQWIEVVSLHENRHIMQMQEILEIKKKKLSE
ncbi:DinB family protein [Bacillus sp. DJP31]|uniref:DinB family protein n=1 Tax=Bacillus sp. DJP31 TaxID=3409789 RepID=UPI003BB5A658